MNHSILETGGGGYKKQVFISSYLNKLMNEKGKITDL